MVRQRADFSKGQYLNAGPAARIAGHMVTLEYCRELGVPIEVFTNANADAYYYNQGVGPLSGRPIPPPHGQGRRSTATSPSCSPRPPTRARSMGG